MSDPIRVRSRQGTAEVDCRWTRGRIDQGAAQALCAAAEELRLDSELRLVLLRSTGADFCLGFDDRTWGAELDCIAAIASLPQPVVAVVGGRAWAEGCELALACDLRLVSDDASFRLPQIAAGRLPSHGATQRLPRLVGATRALDLLWSGRAVGAEEAERIGLASRRVTKGRLAATTRKLAAELSAKGPIALRLAKEAVRAAGDLTLEQGIRLEQDLYVLLQTTADRADGVSAFLAKRKPRFTGR